MESRFGRRTWLCCQSWREPLRKNELQRRKALAALKKESELALRDQIRHLLALKPEQRTNFLQGTLRAEITDRFVVHVATNWDMRSDTFVENRFGIDFRFHLPDRKFNRRIGVFAGLRFDPGGRPMGEDDWQRGRAGWLPTTADADYLKSLQATAVYERGRFANYIAPPLRGINQKPIDFEYVRTEV